MTQLQPGAYCGKVVLVTGGAGFIGSHLVRRLLENGHEVRVLDSLISGSPQNLAEVHERIQWMEGSVTDNELVQKAVDGVDCIFHLAAIPSVPRSVRDPIGTNDGNVNGTLGILCAAREAGVRRLVFAGSSSVYGDSPRLPKEEAMAAEPTSPYAVAKLAAEQYCRAFYLVYGFETVALRYFNVFGPRQDPNSEYSAVIPAFIAALLEGREITIYGDGEQSRDFTYVDNTIDANLYAATAPVAGEMCNVATGASYSLNQLVQALGEIMNIKPQVRYLDARLGDVKHSLASIEKAERLLGYKPEISFHEGLKRTVEYFEQLKTSGAR